MRQTSRNTDPSQSRVLRALVVLATIACSAVLVLMFKQLGSAAIMASVRRLGPLWGPLIALELGRIVCELIATRALFGVQGSSLSRLRLLRGQLLGQMLDVIMPAGRTSAETAKAVVYARDTGWPQALAVGTALQLAVVAANALWVLGGFWVSSDYGLPHTLRAALLGYAIVTGSVVIGVALFAIAPAVREHATRFPTIQQSLERFAHLVIAVPGRIFAAVLAQALGRTLQTLQLWLLVSTLGAEPSLGVAYLTEAVYLVGASLGELVPAQLGTTDAMFVVAAPSLGLSPASAFSATLGLHAVQVLIALLCGVSACLLWLLEPRSDSVERSEAAAVVPATETPPVPDHSPGE